MVDGLIFKDFYPGYQKVEELCLEAHKLYRQRNAELIDDLRDIRDQASEAMNEAARDLSLRRNEYDSIVQARSRLNAAFVDFERQLERTAEALLSIYREANRKSRTAPAPARFNQPFPFVAISPTLDAPGETAWADLRKSIADAQQALHGQIEAVHKAFDDAVASYREIEDIMAVKSDGPPPTSA
jgi:hypothetical protein